MRGAALFAAIPGALLLAALGELSTIPAGEWSLASLGVATFELGVNAWAALAMAALAGLFGLAAPIAQRPRLVAAAVGATGVGAALATFMALIDYPPFATPLALAVWLGFGALLAAVYVLCVAAPGRKRWLSLAGIVASIAAVASYAVAQRFLDPRYPSLHLSLAGVRLLGLHAGLAALLTHVAPRRLAGAAAATTAVAATLVAAGASAELGSAARQSVLAFTSIGQALPGDPVSLVCDRPAAAFDPDAAQALFARESGLPALPDDFDLSRYNVLLIMSDTLRYDRSSLARPDSDGALRALAAEGSFWMSRGYAPSLLTWQSVAALFSLTHQSHARTVAKVPPWQGALAPEQRTLPELFSAAGYDTFAVRHQYEFPGIDRGFASVHAEPEFWDPRTLVDENIAARAIDAIAARAHQPRPFFGWIFFYSPHAPYLEPRGGQSAYDTAVTHMEHQLGRVLAYLERADLLERTVIVFVADHGEGLGDHDIQEHGFDVFEPAIHVPIVVRLPGVEGRQIERPISMVHVFPWLLSHGNPVMRAAAREVIAADLAPMLAAVGPHAVVEGWNTAANLVALVGPRYKSHVDLRTGRHRVYDLSADPDERAPLPADSAVHAEHEALFARYAAARACRQRLTLSDEHVGRPAPLPSRGTRYQSRAEHAVPAP